MEDNKQDKLICPKCGKEYITKRIKTSIRKLPTITTYFHTAFRQSAESWTDKKNRKATILDVVDRQISKRCTVVGSNENR
jgi:ribosomal protein L37AE/L43A